MKFGGKRVVPGGILAAGAAGVLFAMAGLSCFHRVDEPAPVLLSQEERAWLTEHPEQLTLLYNTDFPPIEFAATNGAFVGFGADIIVQVEKRLGVTFLKRSAGNWNEHLAALERGDCAIAPTIVQTAERERYALFTKPYVTTPVVIITSTAAQENLTFDDLAGKRVAVVSGFATENYVRSRSNKRFEIVCVSNVSEGVRSVSFGQVDALVENIAVAAYYIRQEGLSNLRVAGSTDYQFELRIGVSQHYPLLFTSIQKALDAVPKEEIDTIYNRWISLNSSAGLNPKLKRLLGFGALFVTALVLSLSIITMILKRQLNEKIIRLGTAQEELLAQTARLRASENLNRAFFDQTFQFFGLLDVQGNVVKANETALRFIRKTMDEVAGTPFHESGWWESQDAAREICSEAYQEAARGKTFRREVRHQNAEGVEHLVDFSLSPLMDEKGNILFFIAEGRDITDRKRAEEEREKLQGQLLQAHKMEAVGRLAGGVAHDFNNMLQAIIGHADLALERIDAAHPLYSDLTEIRKAAERSSDLTRQLLAFARKQTVAPKVLDLNETVAGMLKMLRRIIGENIDLAWLPGNGLWPINVDPVQIDQILANLCVNARDAIAGIGKITIRTDNCAFDETYCANHPGFSPGAYIMLSVMDSGCGMEKETIENIFEPFYTTKALGQGTGLGLATIYGAIKQNEGFIAVQSELGKGTTFEVYFPRYAGPIPQVSKQQSAAPLKGHGETVLLVEDEPAILDMGKRLLKRMGYAPIAMASPQEALAFAQEYKGEIHLVITDVIMPAMNGWELSKQLRASRPSIKCLFMSGYTADVLAPHGVLDEDLSFIQKPFTAQKLSDKLREVLGSGE